jgi:hypothetical protein
MRAIWHNILEISDMLCVRRMMYSIFVSSPPFLGAPMLGAVFETSEETEWRGYGNRLWVIEQAKGAPTMGAV